MLAFRAPASRSKAGVSIGAKSAELPEFSVMAGNGISDLFLLPVETPAPV
jgi:hypothetical protein